VGEFGRKLKLCNGLHYFFKTRTLAPPTPTLCDTPMRGALGICRGPAVPRNCCTSSYSWAIPVAPMGCPRLSSPPSVFTPTSLHHSLSVLRSPAIGLIITADRPHGLRLRRSFGRRAPPGLVKSSWRLHWPPRWPLLYRRLRRNHQSCRPRAPWPSIPQRANR